MASSASALTMTFDEGLGIMADTNGNFIDDLYSEDGIDMTGFTSGEFGEGDGRAHLDNPSDGHFTKALSFSTGDRFDLVSFELFPLNGDCFGCSAYDNVIVTGYRGGLTIAQSIFAMGAAPSLFFGSLFLDLDELIISTVNGPSPEHDFTNTHFEIDNVSLSPTPSPVPLPSALGPFAVALLCAGFWLSRNQKTAKVKI